MPENTLARTKIGRRFDLARIKRKPVVVEERKIGVAEISRPGAPAKPGVTPTPAPTPTVSISLDTLRRAKDAVAGFGERGECINPDELATQAGISREEAEASIAAMQELEFGAPCCRTYFCSHHALRNMFDRINRWRGIA